ncbi:gap junction delta-3 protein-like [Onychomys torridus]|uniref:gap junction delta-3 protein-like n=1 Tax=Onychomys torridus TaxID=38674 RepID=UPI00167F64DB|nr:gap junction delta-3 protein-like [Onychomys torridus]
MVCLADLRLGKEQCKNKKEGRVAERQERLQELEERSGKPNKTAPALPPPPPPPPPPTASTGSRPALPPRRPSAGLTADAAFYWSSPPSLTRCYETRAALIG